MSLFHRLNAAINRAAPAPPPVLDPRAVPAAPIHAKLRDLPDEELLAQLATSQAHAAELAAIEDPAARADFAHQFALWLEDDQEYTLIAELTRRGIPIPEPIDPPADRASATPNDRRATRR